MGWQDRDYSRENGTSANPLMWLLTGRLKLFRAFDITVHAHASMVLYGAFVLLLGFGAQGFTWQDRVANVTMVFAIVLLHEFGHCFAARKVGGEADEILMTPIGGLAFARPPKRPLPTFLTVAAGPGVNVLLCVLTGGVILALTGQFPWKPFFLGPQFTMHGVYDLLFYCYWIYQVSAMLLLFNLLPIWPLDGGQMVQSMLWPRMGYYRSMMASTMVGMVGSGLMIMFSIATLALGLAVLFGFMLYQNLQMRQALQAAGPGEFADDDLDLSAAFEHPDRPKKKPTSAETRAAKKAAKAAAAERAERERVDQILAKIASQGRGSLTFWEKRALKKATHHMRQRDRTTRLPTQRQPSVEDN
jgi:Zn-dependent protease